MKEPNRCVEAPITKPVTMVRTSCLCTDGDTDQEHSDHDGWTLCLCLRCGDSYWDAGPVVAFYGEMSA